MENFKMVTKQYKSTKPLNARIQLHKDYGTNPISWFEWYFEKIEFVEGATILDVGCGTGLFWAENANKLPNQVQLVLIDASPGMIKEAKNNLEGAGVNADYYVGDVKELPFDVQHFDIVMANHMLYHLSNTERLSGLKELHRVLKDTGLFYASTIGQRHLTDLSELIKGFDSSLRYETSMYHEVFGLQNGAKQINAFFNDVSVHRYECDLEVQEARPIVDYVLSTMSDAAEHLKKDDGRQFERELDARIHREGSLQISKETGFFKATK